MTTSTIDLTERLDQLEQRLPVVPAKSVAFGRAAVRRTNDVFVSAIADVARRVDSVVGTARAGVNQTTGQASAGADRTATTATTTAKQVAGQARSAMERTSTTAATTAKQVVGQARSAAQRTAQMAATTAQETVGQAKSAVERTVNVAESSTKATIGQATTQAGRTAAAARTATGELLDDATAAVDPDSPSRGIAYEEWTKADLYDRAQVLDIEGRSTMSKSELIDALRSAS